MLLTLCEVVFDQFQQYLSVGFAFFLERNPPANNRVKDFLPEFVHVAIPAKRTTTGEHLAIQ